MAGSGALRAAGVGAQSEAIRGELPAVRGRAFIRRHDSDSLEEIELQRKTLWFLPDSDIALLIFTGNAPLTHLLDESIESVMLALDRCDAPRSFDYFQQVFRKRSDDDASPFEFLFDPDLMPAEMGLNVIQAVSDHPSDLRYDPSPTSLGDSAVFYRRIREAIALHQQQTAAEPASVTLPDVPDLPAEDGNDAFSPIARPWKGRPSAVCAARRCRAGIFCSAALSAAISRRLLLRTAPSKTAFLMRST